jgi:hypothetical protein
LSSTTRISFARASSTSRRRRSKDIVTPAGFWKLGTE